MREKLLCRDRFFSTYFNNAVKVEELQARDFDRIKTIDHKNLLASITFRILTNLFGQPPK